MSTEIWKSDDAIFLVGRGDFETPEDLMEQAVLDGTLENEDISAQWDIIDYFEKGYWKAVPSPEGGTMYHKMKRKIKGAFFATVITRLW